MPYIGTRIGNLNNASPDEGTPKEPIIVCSTVSVTSVFRTRSKIIASHTREEEPGDLAISSQEGSSLQVIIHSTKNGDGTEGHNNIQLVFRGTIFFKLFNEFFNSFRVSFKDLGKKGDASLLCLKDLCQLL